MKKSFFTKWGNTLPILIFFFLSPFSVVSGQALPDTMWLDVSIETPAQSNFVFQDRFIYTVTIDGTFSVWNSWGGGSCGDFQGVPRYASPNVLNGPAGVDPAYIFAAPITTPFCSSTLPASSGDFKVSTDGGQTFFNPRPINDSYSTEHTYTYEFRGEGHTLQTFMDDEPYEDNYGLLRFVIESATPVSNERETPSTGGITLNGNYPNPVQDRTTIHFKLDQAKAVKLEVFDILGRTASHIHEGMLAPGDHQFEVTTSSYTNGLYFYRLSSADVILTRTFMVAR